MPHDQSNNPRLETRDDSQLIGLRQPLSSGGSETKKLWRRFMPRLGEIKQRRSKDLISMRVFHAAAGELVTPLTSGDEWAAVEVSEIEDLPSGMETCVIPSGVYAVFIHRGPAATFPSTARNAYGNWIPNSDYELDDRPHFAVMGPNYRPDDPDAEEEFWIPIRTTT